MDAALSKYGYACISASSHCAANSLMKFFRMIELTRSDSSNRDFQLLVTELDKELAIRDGADHAFYHQYNGIDQIKHVVLAGTTDGIVGCGAIKEYAADTMEVKRMYVPADKRGQGIASVILRELENWAREMNYKKCILETGLAQPEAIRLYQKNDYTVIPNYGQYAEAKGSICFEKALQ